MKKKPASVQRDEPQPDGLRREKRRRALSRVQQKREEKKTDASREREAVFNKKLKSAGDRRSPMTKRTRGYYRFSKEYPGEVDAEGLRENRERRGRRRALRLLWALLAVLVFAGAYLLTRTAALISREPAVQAQPTQPAQDALPGNIMRMDPHIPEADVPAAAETLKKLGGTTAMLEYKAEDGTLYADYSQVIAALKENGLGCAAYISCFKDSEAPRRSEALSVTRKSADGGRWTDNAGNGWLNPFSEDARNFILRAVSAAAAEGFDYIILDNVCFPADSGSAPAYYKGEDTYAGTRNGLLRDFVYDAVESAGDAQTVLMLRPSGLNPSADPDRAPYFGHLLNTEARYICADARISVQPKNVTVGTKTFDESGDIPFAFVLAVSELAAENAGDRPLLVCVDADENAEESALAAEYAGAKGCIYR